MLAVLPAASTPSPTPSPAPAGTPGAPGTGSGYEVGGPVTLTAGIVLVFLLIWLVQRRSGSGGVAVVAFTAGVLLAATEVGRFFAQLGSTTVNSGVEAVTQIFS